MELSLKQKQAIADEWLSYQPMVGIRDSIATLVTKLDMVNVLAEAKAAVKYNPNVNLANKYTSQGLRVICEIVGIDHNKLTNAQLAPALSKCSKLHLRVSSVMLRYKNIVKITTTCGYGETDIAQYLRSPGEYYVARKPIRALCSKMEILGGTAHMLLRPNCKEPGCECIRIRCLFIPELYTFTLRHSIADMQADLAKYNKEATNEPHQALQMWAAASQKVDQEAAQRKLPAPTELRSGAKWTAEEDAKLTQQHKNGMSLVAIAADHGRTTTAIRSRMTKLGLK